MSYETQRAELVARIEKLAGELVALDQAAHVEKARQALADAAKAGADDAELAALGDALRRASDGSDEAGQARTIAQARKEAAEADLRELEAAEQARQREQLAAESMEAGKRLQEAAQQAAEAFRQAVRAHLRVSTLLERRERAKAALQGRQFDGIGRGELFAFPPVDNRFGDVAPAFALGRDDPELQRMIATVTAEVANELQGVAA